MKRVCVLILVLLWAWSVIGNDAMPGDSVGVRTVNGQSLVVYKVSAGETAYAVSRKFAIPFKELSAANAGVDLGALKPGQEILVPGILPTTTSATEKRNTQIIKEEPVAVKEEPIVEKAADVKEELVVKDASQIVKQDEHVAKEESTITSENQADTSIVSETVLSSTDLASAPVTPGIEKNKSFAQLYADYMSTDMLATSEKGVATWIDNNGIATSGDRFYALHSAAPIGSIVKVRNMMNNRSIYAKVIGNLSASEQQEKVLIKLSSGAAERLNVLDNRFVVEITYYAPDDKAMK